MVAIPAHERWKIAESRATERFGRQANKEKLAEHKKTLKTLCEHAAIAVEKGHAAVLIEPCA